MSVLPGDSLDALRRDVATVRRARGPLRRDMWVRAHFWNRLMALKASK